MNQASIEELNIKHKRHPLLFRFPGGKHYAIKILRPFFEDFEHSEYREPFVGGGSVFLNKDKVPFNWLNDIDQELMTTYKIIQSHDQRRKLIQRLSKEIASKQRWREILNFIPKNDHDVAFKYFYLNRTSFSGKLVSPAWGYRPKRSLPPERWYERIEPCGQKLQDVYLSCIDFEQVIRERKKNYGPVLMYIDPPYYHPPQKKHYRHGLSKKDHERLALSLKETNHSFFLTYDDCPEVRQMYKWANIYELQFFYRVQNSNTSQGNRKNGFEIIITNYLPKSLS